MSLRLSDNRTYLRTASSVPGLWDRLCVHSACRAFTAPGFTGGKPVGLSVLFLYPLPFLFFLFRFFILGYLVLAIVILAVQDYGSMKRRRRMKRMGRRMCGKMSRRTHGRTRRRMHRGKRGGPPSCAPSACGLRRPWSSFRQAIFCLNTGCSGDAFRRGDHAHHDGRG